MKTSKAIILAAGRGSRLADMTEEKPKCMVELNNRPLIAWQSDALRDGGVSDLCVVTGYRSEMIEALGHRTICNADWSSTNMVASLLCAEDQITEPTIASYSDIVYSSEVVRRMIDADGDVVVAYDTDWLRLWNARFDDPLSDAESLKIDDDGKIIEIGQKANDVSEIQGQYLGLLRFSPRAIAWIREIVDAEEGLREKLDMTSLLQLLISGGYAVQGLAIRGNWCEIDDQDDLRVAEQLLSRGELRLKSHTTETVHAASYDYAEGNLLDERNTYFYTQFQGEPFVEAWRRNRQLALSDLPSPVPPQLSRATDLSLAEGDTGELLEVAFALTDQDCDAPLLENLLKKFEVSKRIHSAYDDRFRTVDKQAHRDLALYVRLAEVFERRCAAGDDIRFLNVLLKVMDVLVAHRADLSGGLGGRLAWLIRREADHVDTRRETLERAA